MYSLSSFPLIYKVFMHLYCSFGIPWPKIWVRRGKWSWAIQVLEDAQSARWTPDAVTWSSVVRDPGGTERRNGWSNWKAEICSPENRLKHIEAYRCLVQIDWVKVDFRVCSLVVSNFYAYRLKNNDVWSNLQYVWLYCTQKQTCNWPLMLDTCLFVDPFSQPMCCANVEVDACAETSRWQVSQVGDVIRVVSFFGG